ncbi:MAG: hypothetical protein ACOYJ1_00605 [Peptococcales bacterium]|jgi:hypothetical protein
MKIKKNIVLVLAMLLFIVVVGCNKQSNVPLQVQNPESLKHEEERETTKQEETLDSVDNTNPEVVEREYGDITDPVELEKLWQEYFYDSITTIGNTREFNSPEEINPLNVAEFSWFKYVAEHGKDSLELARKDSSLRLFPLDLVLKYANRYFNLDSLDVTKIEDNYYDSEKQAFLFNLGSEQKRPSYTDNNSWGIHLDKVTRNKDGSITAVMVSYDTYQTRRVELTKTFTLKERPDSSLYFKDGRWEYINNHLVSITGDYQHFAKIEGFDGYYEELSMLGEDNNRLIMAKLSYGKKKDAALLLVNLDTMQVEKKLDLDTNLAFSDINMSGDKIVVRLKDKIILFDKSLKQSQEMLLPETIKKTIEREPKYDNFGMPDIYFGGYDISKDLNRIAYADEIGVKLFNIAENSEVLLSSTVPIEGSELINSSFHSNPRFVDNDRKVITTMTGYESTMGYTLCDLEDGSSKSYGISAEASSTGFIRYDTGLLEVNAYINNEEKQIGENKTLYLDFKKGTVKEIFIEEVGDTGYIRLPEYCYIGQNYAAFITTKYDTSDNAQSMYYLNRLDLNSLEVETNKVAVKAAPIQILGVLADGLIVFSYYLNPSENGVCITN